MRPQRTSTTTTTTARRPATGPVKATATALSKHPSAAGRGWGRYTAIGLAFWAGFAVLVLHYLGVIPWGQPTAADIWPPHPAAAGSR